MASADSKFDDLSDAGVHVVQVNPDNAECNLQFMTSFISQTPVVGNPSCKTIQIIPLTGFLKGRMFDPHYCVSGENMVN